jgi:hypothetical protein
MSVMYRPTRAEALPPPERGRVGEGVNFRFVKRPPPGRCAADLPLSGGGIGEALP